MKEHNTSRFVFPNATRSSYNASSNGGSEQPLDNEDFNARQKAVLGAYK